MNRELIIGLAVAMGTPKATAEANFDAAYPPASDPGPNDVVGGGIEVRGGARYETVIYGDGRREETLIGG